jgi:hypothetical protein
MLSPQVLHKLILARIPLALTFTTSLDRTEVDSIIQAVHAAFVAGEVTDAGEGCGATGVWAGGFGRRCSLSWVEGAESLLHGGKIHGFG